MAKKLSIPGGLNVAEKRGEEQRGASFKNKGKYDSVAQLKAREMQQPNQGVGSWHTGPAKKK
jgi:hypothetical protein